MHQYLNDPTLAVPVFPGSHIVMDDGYIFVSGLTVTDIQGGESVVGDIAEETRWVMRRLARMLEYAGASLADTVRVDVHLTNLDTIHTMDAAYAEFFDDHRYPARTCTESPRSAAPRTLRSPSLPVALQKWKPTPKADSAHRTPPRRYHISAITESCRARPYTPDRSPPHPWHYRECA
ncbi:RidA family protein [Halomonas sp. BC04]|uniref:RidA family protein n=1 Tax=Halomonas sp. BC04 TaxID=1403540 RepID=UPI0026C4F307